MRRFLIISCFSLVSISLAGGCGLINSLIAGPNSPETGSSKLIPFASEDELADYLSGEIQRRNNAMIEPDRAFGGDGVFLNGDAPAPAVPDSGAATGAEGGDQASDDSDGFSGTTIQEAGVDEADVVKTDGDFVYLVDDGVDGGSVLRIVAVDPTGPMNVASETSLEGYGRQFYLYDNKVIALTSTGGGYYGVPFGPEPMPVDDGIMGDADIMPPYQYERPKTIVTILDVSNRTAPAQLSKTAFEGSQSSSRLIDGVLHLIVSNYQSYYYDVFPLLGTRDLDATIEDTAQVLPKYTRVAEGEAETTGNTVTWESMYHPEDPDGFGVVTVISLDVDNDAAFTSVGVAAEPGLVYSSTGALYLTDTEYNFSGGQRETTDIYKFTYVGRGAAPAATGSVPGRILNQYSMGEHEDNLRVASTVGPVWGVFGQTVPSSNDVYVLQQNDTSLEVIGSVIGMAPGETIRSARFMGKRGYVVTFLQIDPLFTLDLSQADNPRVIGELEVPGFSTYIVPMDDDHLLTVGQYIPPPGAFGPWAVQLSIYDISDFANPTVMDNIILGRDTGAHSEAINNPKAFNYYADRGMIALPLSIYNDRFWVDDVIAVEPDPDDGTDTDGDPPPDSTVDAVTDESIAPCGLEGFEGVAVLSATVETGFTEIGGISTRYPDAGHCWSEYTRGVFIGDDCLAVTNNGIRRTIATDTETITGELVFE